MMESFYYYHLTTGQPVAFFNYPPAFNFLGYVFFIVFPLAPNADVTTNPLTSPDTVCPAVGHIQRGGGRAST